MDRRTRVRFRVGESPTQQHFPTFASEKSFKMPGVGVGGKRGTAMRQHQLGSKSRMLRSRNQAPPVLPDDIVTQKTLKEEQPKTSPIPPACNPSLPELTCLGNMGFEVLLFLYLHTALFCQYIYLYKSVWWYPVSLPPSTTSLNFHLIDRNLTFFLSIFIARRLLWSVLWDFLRPSSDNAPGILAWILICFIAGVVWICFLITPLVQLFHSTSILNMVVLCYPILLWIPLTGLSGDSCLNLVLSWSSISDKSVNGEAGDGGAGSSKQCTDGSLARLLHHSDSNNPQITYASFANSTDPQVIRREVKLLCQDFNSRVSEIVFCSMVCAYYVGLVPMFFMKSHQYYDMVWSLQHTVLVLLNSFGLLSSHLLNPQYLHVLHKCSLLLEEFKPETNQSASEKDTQKDIHGPRYSTQRNDQMKSATNLSDSTQSTQSQQGDKSASSSGSDDATNMRFYYMFSNPLRLTNWLLLAHIVIVVFQVYLLMSSSKWDHLISIALMQFFSYYVLFRSTRDRLVLEKAHAFHNHLFRKDR